MRGCHTCAGRLSIIGVGVAAGFVTGLSMALFAWSAYWWGHGVPMVAQWGEIYQGYAATIRGGWIGAAWGFLDGFISGAIFALIYNLVTCCCHFMCRRDETEVKVVKTKKM